MSTRIVFWSSWYSSLVITPRSFSWCHLSSWLINSERRDILFPGDTIASGFFFPKIYLFGGSSIDSCLCVWITCAQQFSWTGVYLLLCISLSFVTMSSTSLIMLTNEACYFELRNLRRARSHPFARYLLTLKPEYNRLTLLGLFIHGCLILISLDACFPFFPWPGIMYPNSVSYPSTYCENCSHTFALN